MKQAIEERFGDSEWTELAYLTNGGKEIILNHPRLLRSLRFNDEDYCHWIPEVLESLVKKDRENIDILSEYLDLQTWLRKKNPREYEILFGHAESLIDELKYKAIDNSFDLNQYIQRIKDNIDSDPELAVGSMKELLESVMKCVLQANEVPIERRQELQELLKQTQKVLKLDPSEFDNNQRGAELIKRILSNLGQVVQGVGELRNLYGTGHGRTRSSGITPRHARLVVNSGASLAVFLIETFEHHQQLS